jgi:hypothetical protein
MSLNFVAFVTFWLTLTVHLTPSKNVWPLVALLGTLLLLCSPMDWMPEWSDAAQRAALLRVVKRALSAPFAKPSFAACLLAAARTRHTTPLSRGLSCSVPRPRPVVDSLCR